MRAVARVAVLALATATRSPAGRFRRRGSHPLPCQLVPGNSKIDKGCLALRGATKARPADPQLAQAKKALSEAIVQDTGREPRRLVLPGPLL